ncbi:HDOD domain-containing protein, partial [Candidatus Latescibacterota bacterium]
MPTSFIEKVEELILSNLHSSPTVANEVLKIIHDESSSVNDLVKILEHDPPITAMILKIANSAYYSPTTPIDSLSRAIVALGFMTIRDIATSASIIPYFYNSKNSSGIDLPGLWLHSMGTAKAAQIIAEKIHFGNQGIVFITGLLHDIGKIIIWVYFPEYYYQITELTTHDKVRSILAERKVL